MSNHAASSRAGLPPRRKATSRLVVIVVAVCSAGAMAAAVRWYYARQSAALEASTLRELRAIGEGKLTQIARWRSERLGDGRILAASPLMDDARRILGGVRPRPIDGISLYGNALKREFGYKDIMIADR